VAVGLACLWRQSSSRSKFALGARATIRIRNDDGFPDLAYYSLAIAVTKLEASALVHQRVVLTNKPRGGEALPFTSSFASLRMVK